MKKVREGYKEYEFGVIPNDWQVKKLGDIFNDLKGGSTPSRLIDRYYTGDIPWITSGELKYKTIYNTLESITEEAVKDTNLKLYPQGTFFIAITGLEAEGTRGSCAITGVPATTNQSCLAFQPKEGFSNLYLYHWYRLYGNYIGLKYTQGTKQQSLNNKIVGKLEIPVPKLEEQEKIASILSTVDEQIDNVDALIEKNKELKKGLMQTLLTKGIGHTKFKKTEIGEIPEEWSIKTIGDVINLIKSGLSRSLKDEDIGIPCIRSNNINNYKFDKSDLKYWFLEDNKGANINDYILREGDILVNFINSLAQIGKTCLYKDIGRPVIYTTNIFRMNLNEQIILNKYFYYISQTEMYNNEIKLITKPAVNQASFTVADFKSIKISVPPINEQIRIVSILSEVDEKVEESEEKKQKLEELKKGLMQQLLTGKIRV